MSERLTRREFLEKIGLLTTSAVLGGCKRKITPTPEPTPTQILTPKPI